VARLASADGDRRAATTPQAAADGASSDAGAPQSGQAAQSPGKNTGSGQQASPDSAQQQSSPQAGNAQSAARGTSASARGRPESGKADADGVAGTDVEEWLRQVPDDPGGLLRRKFAQQHARGDATAAMDPPW